MELNKNATTQYGDMKGTVAIGWPDVLQFSEFIEKKHGVDTAKYLPVGIEVFAGEFS